MPARGAGHFSFGSAAVDQGTHRLVDQHHLVDAAAPAIAGRPPRQIAARARETKALRRLATEGRALAGAGAAAEVGAGGKGDYLLVTPHHTPLFTILFTTLFTTPNHNILYPFTTLFTPPYHNILYPKHAYRLLLHVLHPVYSSDTLIS